MGQDIERVQARLSNIHTVEPILVALRTISLGSWQMALNRRADLQGYSSRLLALIPSVLPHLHPERDWNLEARLRALAPRIPYVRRYYQAPGAALTRQPKSAVALVIGSERGLCGRFNAIVVEHADKYLPRRQVSGGQIELAALGSRVARTLEREGHEPAWARRLPVTTLVPFSMAQELTRQWLRRYEAHDIDAVDIIYNAYQGAGDYAPIVKRLLPPELPDAARISAGALWPPIIVETDPLSLYTRLVGQWLALSFYYLLLDSAASEHSARFQLMESATKNTQRLIEELTMEVQSARRQAITQEMQELAAGSGLLG